MAEVTAYLHHARISPQKVRLVADAVRGLSAAAAAVRLKTLETKAAPILAKLLASALANAKNRNLDSATLRIQTLTIDGGPMLKRTTPKAHGRAAPIRRRTSHISLTLVTAA